jgi:hypothetical protein
MILRWFCTSWIPPVVFVVGALTVVITAITYFSNPVDVYYGSCEDSRHREIESNNWLSVRTTDIDRVRSEIDEHIDKYGCEIIRLKKFRRFGHQQYYVKGE